MSWARLILLVFVGFTLHDTFGQQQNRDRRKGAYIGQLEMLQHKVSGKVWAVDEDKLFIENFTFDGRSPDTFFWIGNGSQPNPWGHMIRYPLDSRDEKPVQLPQMDGQDILLHLPPRVKITDMDWLSVWCRRFTVDNGHVKIPSDLEPPRKRVLPELQRLAHQLRSGNITILDAKTFYIPNLHYDGKGPDAYFWVGKGTDPDPMGHKIPNEMGSLDILRAYEGEDIELQLPENLTVYDIDYLAVWCVAYKHNFGHVQIPPADDLWVPPALGQTRIKPHWWYSGETGQPEDLLEAYRSDQRDVYLSEGVPRAPPSVDVMNGLVPSSPRSGAPTDSQSGLAPQAGSSSGSGPHSPNTGGASSPLPPATYLALCLLILILMPRPTPLL